MSKGLIKLSSGDATGLANLELRGITTDYPVCLLSWNNVQPAVDNKNIFFQLTELGGSEITSANYSNATFNYNSTSSATSTTGTGATQLVLHASMGNALNETGSGQMWIFNAGNIIKYTHIVMENVCINSAAVANAYQGGHALEVANQIDGVKFYCESSVNFASGNFVLYGINNK